MFNKYSLIQINKYIYNKVAGSELLLIILLTVCAHTVKPLKTRSLLLQFTVTRRAYCSCEYISDDLTRKLVTGWKHDYNLYHNLLYIMLYKYCWIFNYPHPSTGGVN